MKKNGSTVLRPWLGQSQGRNSKEKNTDVLSYLVQSHLVSLSTSTFLSATLTSPSLPPKQNLLVQWAGGGRKQRAEHGVCRNKVLNYSILNCSLQCYVGWSNQSRCADLEVTGSDSKVLWTRLVKRRHGKEWGKPFWEQEVNRISVSWLCLPSQGISLAVGGEQQNPLPLVTHSEMASLCLRQQLHVRDKGSGLEQWESVSGSSRAQ